MALSRWMAVLCLALACGLLIGVGEEGSHLGADVQMLRSRASADVAWRALGAADYEAYMAFCRRRIPPHSVVISVVVAPAFGYYRANYALYPRTVWPYVSPLGPMANAPHPLSHGLLASVLRQTRARYLAVWHVALPHPLPPVHWIATFAPDEYVVALR